MKRITLFLIFGLIGCLLSCSSEPEDPILGTWDWTAGSREISPAGFESLHRDRSESYLVGDAVFTFAFKDDGTFDSMYNIPGRPEPLYAGTWSVNSNILLMNYTEPSDFQGGTEYRILFSDDSNIDLQWFVQYDEFTDAQKEKWTEEGLIGMNGWTVDKDSMLTNFGTVVTATITLHFVKIED